MAKKLIDVMDTTFRDGFQSVFGGRVLLDDFLPAVEAAKEAGISHFEFGGGARFQSLFFYLNENAFDMMDTFREKVGKEANLQTLARGVNTVMLDTGSSELIDLHAKLFKKHGTTTIRNFDALNDVENLKYSGQCIKKYGLKHEVVITIMDLPPGCKGAHDVEHYERVLRRILDEGIEIDSLCFKDASGTANPRKVYESIKMAKSLLPEHIHVRLHTHESAGTSVVSYLAALEAGADGIDLAASPVSGGSSQPDFLTLLHALKGSDYDLGGLSIEKILVYEEVLKDQLKNYFTPPEATQVSPLIPFSPMPGGALTANTQMMRDNNTMDKFPKVIKAMREVVEKGGFGTSVTPVSQFYWQQAYANVMFGAWKQITPGYGKMVLGYFGKTPVAPDPQIVELAQKQLNLMPTTKTALEIADSDPKKSLSHFKKILEENNLETSDENIFIAAACGDKGITFLKGEAKINVRKLEDNAPQNQVSIEGKYTIIIDGQKKNIEIIRGHNATLSYSGQPHVSNVIKSGSNTKKGPIEVKTLTPGNVWKIVASIGDKLEEGDTILILEAMKMEIEVSAPQSGILKTIEVNKNEAVTEGQVVATLE